MNLPNDLSRAFLFNVNVAAASAGSGGATV